MNGLDYRVGSIIEYRTFMDALRRVKVTGREDDIEGTGHPGFDGEMVGSGKKVWGFDDQIVDVVSF